MATKKRSGGAGRTRQASDSGTMPPPKTVRFPHAMRERLEKEAEERKVTEASIVTEALEFYWDMEDASGGLMREIRAAAYAQHTTPGKLLGSILAKRK